MWWRLSLSTDLFFFVLLSIHAHALIITVPLRLRFKIWGDSFLRWEWNDGRTKQRGEKDEQRKFNSFCCTSVLLLSVVCCVALIHVELKLQEHHGVISQSATFCDQMEKEVIQEVQQNYERWQINKVRNSEGTWQEAQGEVIIFKLLRRRTPLFGLLYTKRAVG